MGLTSFGKGSVQTVIPLARRPGRRGQADDGALLHALGALDPEDRHRNPDLEVAETREEAQDVANQAFQFSEASFRNALNTDEGQGPGRAA